MIMNYEKFSSISAALSSQGLVGLSINSLHIVRRKRNISTGLDEDCDDDDDYDDDDSYDDDDDDNYHA